MKYRIVKIMVIIGLFFAVSEVKAISILGMGDSITTGYGVEQGYFSIICDKYTKVEKTVCKNEAINGLTTEGLLKKLEEDVLQEEIRKADLIFLSIGGNDFLKELSRNIGTYLASSSGNIEIVGKDLIQNLEQIYQKIVQIKATVKIYVVPLYNPYYRILSKNQKAINAFNLIKKKFIDVTKQYHIQIIDTLSDELENEVYLNVTFTNLDPHPNQKGHEKIASSFYKIIKKDHSFSYKNRISIIFFIFIFLLLIIGIIMNFQRKKRK